MTDTTRLTIAVLAILAISVLLVWAAFRIVRLVTLRGEIERSCQQRKAYTQNCSPLALGRRNGDGLHVNQEGSEHDHTAS